MEKLLFFELKKISGNLKITILIIFAMLCNGILCYIYCYNLNKTSIPNSIVNEYFNDYRDNMNAKKENEDSTLISGDDNMVSLNNLMSEDNRDWTDADLQSILNNRIKKVTSYKEDLSKLVYEAKLNLQYLDETGDYDNYSWLLNKESILRYQKAKSVVNLGIEYDHGWSELFHYKHINLFLFVLAVIIATYSGINEYDYNMHLLLNGIRNKYALYSIKCMSVIIVNVILCLLFVLESIAVIGLTIGFSNITNALQIIDSFRYCPYNITVFGYIIIWSSYKFLCCAFISLFSLLCAIITKKYTIGILMSVSAITLNYYLNTLVQKNPTLLGLSLNVFTLSETNFYFSHLRGLAL